MLNLRLRQLIWWTFGLGVSAVLAINLTHRPPLVLGPSVITALFGLVAISRITGWLRTVQQGKTTPDEEKRVVAWSWFFQIVSALSAALSALVVLMDVSGVFRQTSNIPIWEALPNLFLMVAAAYLCSAARGWVRQQTATQNDPVQRAALLPSLVQNLASRMRFFQVGLVLSTLVWFPAQKQLVPLTALLSGLLLLAQIAASELLLRYAKASINDIGERSEVALSSPQPPVLSDNW